MRLGLASLLRPVYKIVRILQKYADQKVDIALATTGIFDFFLFLPCWRSRSARQQGGHQEQVKALIRKIALFGLFFSFLLLVASTALCQNEVIQREKTMRVQSLSGRVQLGDSPEGVKGVLVEDCTPDWKAVKTSTYTDANGHFNFPDASAKRIHYLRLSFHGAHTLLIKVKIDRSGQKRLHLVLSFST